MAADSAPAYATYLGGAGDDFGGSVAIAPDGDRVFCGSAESDGLATPGAIQAARVGKSDVFVGRTSADGATLEFLTYLGGAGDESCRNIAVDSAGNIIIVGWTSSADFPTANAADSTFAGGGLRDSDAFVAKLSGDGASIVFSTFLGGLDYGDSPFSGGRGDEGARGLAVDSSDRILVSGETAAGDFPAMTVLGDGECGNDPLPVNIPEITDQFVARYLPDGTVDFVTCISGAEVDYAWDVAVNDAGLIYVGGSTLSPDYPTTQPGIGPGPASTGDFDISVIALDASGTQILNSVRLGSTAYDFLQTMEINSDGEIVIQGLVDGPDFPTTAGAWQTEQVDNGGFNRDSFVAALSPQLDELVFATYVGGEGFDWGISMALDDDRPVLQMLSDSRALPVINAVQSQKGPDLDVTALFDTTQASAFSYGSVLGWVGPPIMAIVGPGANRIAVWDLETDQYVPFIELLEGDFDTRDVVFWNFDGDGQVDMVTGNYNGPNFLYLGEAPNGFGPPIPFGDPQGRTTALAVTANDGITCVVEFLEDAVNVQHDFSRSIRTFVEGRPYGQQATASRDAVSKPYPGELIEISAPDQVTVYDGCAQPGEAPTANVITLGGRDLVAAAIGAVNDTDFFDDDLAFADRNGGGVVLFDLLHSDAPVPATATFDGPPTNAITINPYLGVLAASDDAYRYFRLNDDGNLVLDSEQPAVNAPRAVSIAERNVVFSGTTAGTETALLGDDDLYLIRLSDDGADADFATYLGGGGNEDTPYGVAVAGPGRIVATASSSSRSFPVTGAAIQGSQGGQRDAVLYQLEIPSSDGDGDGVADEADNCTQVSNPDQCDTNGDGFGNLCDPDLDNDNAVNFADLGLLKQVFFTEPSSANWNPDADMNGDDVINFADLGIMRSFFFGPPGPSGTAD
ncbi:MAG: SBBP repeat-containing protein [Pseudomonadota bacterium]